MATKIKYKKVERLLEKKNELTATNYHIRTVNTAVNGSSVTEP